MKEKIKSLNVIQIISYTLLIVSFIAIFFTKDKIQNFMFGLFWESILLIVLGTMWFLYKWTKDGINADVKKSKMIINELSNITMAWVVCYVLAFLLEIFFINIISGLRENYYLIVGTFIMTIFTQIIIYVAEEKAYKDTIKIIKNNKLGKNDSNDKKK